MPGLRIRVYVGERDHHGGQPLYTAVVSAARAAGLAGATVLKGIEGFGTHGLIHAARIVDMSSDLPVLIELIDEVAEIRAFLPALSEMLDGGMITLENIEIVRRRESKTAE